VETAVGVTRRAATVRFARTGWPESTLRLEGSEWWWRVVPPLVLIGVVLLALGQFLRVGLVSTDWWPVLAYNKVQNFSDFVRAFREPIGAGDPHFIQQTARHYRPMAVLSFALDYKLWGLNPVGWQLTNLLVHLGVTLGVYALARTLNLARWAATLAALVFTLHPAIVGTEPAIARRHDTLSALFLMIALVLLLRGQRVWPALLIVVSILSKETSLMALPFVPLLLRAAGRPMLRAWVVVPPAIFALALRILALGDLGGYGTATWPTLDALPIYWDKICKFFIELLYPVPIRPGSMATVAVLAFGLCVGAVAFLLPRRERYLALVGLLWVYGFALFYAFLKVYAGSWYLYFPLIGGGLGVAALAAGGVARLPDRRAFAPLGLAGLMCAVVLVGSPLITSYPDWGQTTAVENEYLARVDTCTEDGHPPLFPPNENPRLLFLQAAGLLDYSVTAYIALKFPNGRPCDAHA
jgi:hypothetical protein